MDLNTKDRKVLQFIDLNARASFQTIGKHVGLSKETVIYRINKLEQRKVIQRYITLVNFGKLGYTGYGVYNRFVEVDDQLKDEIVEYLSKIPELYWIALVGGKYDIVFGIMCKSSFQFNKIYYQILGKFGKHLADNTIAIRTELQQNRRNYLVKKSIEAKDPPYFGKEIELEVLDKLDSQLLSILSNNARMSVVDLGRRLNTPPSTIAYRMKQLEKSGLIQSYSTYIRSQNYGMQSYRLLLYLQNMDENGRNRLFSYASANPHMILAIETLGQWNFEITIQVAGHDHLQEEISNLRNAFGDIISNIEFIIMFQDDLIYDPYPLEKESRSTDLGYNLIQTNN